MLLRNTHNLRKSAALLPSLTLKRGSTGKSLVSWANLGSVPRGEEHKKKGVCESRPTNLFVVGGGGITRLSSFVFF